MPKVYKPTVTEAEPFEFRTAARMRSRSVSHTTEPLVAAARFAARPLNRDMFVRVSGVPEKVFMELTVPESPAISKKRPRLEESSPPPPQVYPSFRAQPMPDFSSPEQYPSRSGAIVTRPEPFNMTGEEISRRKRKKFEEEVARQQEEEIARRQFKAQPLYEASPEVHCSLWPSHLQMFLTCLFYSSSSSSACLRPQEEPHEARALQPAGRGPR